MAAPAVSLEFIDFAHRLADEAGKFLVPASVSRPDIELKPDRIHDYALYKPIIEGRGASSPTGRVGRSPSKPGAGSCRPATPRGTATRSRSCAT